MLPGIDMELLARRIAPFATVRDSYGCFRVSTLERFCKRALARYVK